MEFTNEKVAELKFNTMFEEGSVVRERGLMARIADVSLFKCYAQVGFAESLARRLRPADVAVMCFCNRSTDQRRPDNVPAEDSRLELFGRRGRKHPREEFKVPGARCVLPEEESTRER